MSTAVYDFMNLPPVPVDPPMEPVHPGALATDAELCRHWHDLDSHFGTESGSPLHHDWRCPLHGDDVRHRR